MFYCSSASTFSGNYNTSVTHVNDIGGKINLVLFFVSVKGHHKSSTMNDNIKLILGAGGGVLVLTGVIILFIFLRWKRNKKIEKTKQLPSTEATAAREQENLIPNPIYNNNCSKETEVDTKPGVEMLHYPRDSIEQTEILEDGKDSI